MTIFVEAKNMFCSKLCVAKLILFVIYIGSFLLVLPGTSFNKKNMLLIKM